jgi:hypothetical protein
MASAKKNTTSNKNTTSKADSKTKAKKVNRLTALIAGVMALGEYLQNKGTKQVLARACVKLAESRMQAEDIFIAEGGHIRKATGEGTIAMTEGQVTSYCKWAASDDRAKLEEHASYPEACATVKKYLASK